MSGVLGFVEHRCRRCCATLDVYFQQRAVKTWRKHNPVVGTPASAARIWDIGDGYSRPPGGGDLHQLAAGKEAYIAAIRRPERVRSTCGTVQRLRRFTAERAHPQQLGFPGMRDEGDLVTLRRKHGHAAGVAGRIHYKFVGRRDFGVDRYR